MPPRTPMCDLMKYISMTACYVTKWTAVQDVELDDMMGYIQETVNWKSIGWIGDPN